MSHDIDDGLNSGLITISDLKESELIGEILQKVEAEGISEDEDEMFRYRISSHLINHLVYSLLEYSKEKVDNSSILCSTIDASGEIPIGFMPELETNIKKLKKLLFKKLYRHKDISVKMFAGKQAIKGLYSGLMEDNYMLPKFYYQQLDTKNEHRVVADYIAHLSDRYALSFYNEMYGKQ
jgi:dGTPase